MSAWGNRSTSSLSTGPNTGGKTVTLKKPPGCCASWPRQACTFRRGRGAWCRFFHQIHADIGDEQSLEQSLSTFSSHISRIAGILKNSDKRSLVLLDELGAGTDPVEGAALGRAILDHLDEIGCRAMVTTHLGDLKRVRIVVGVAGLSPITFTSPSSEAMPKVRVLCSAGITQPRRSYDPVRLPPWPLPSATLRTLLSPMTGLPRITRTTFPTCRAHYPPGGSSGCACRLLPTLVGAFPKWQEGRHPHCHFRGLHRLHSVTRPPDRSATQGDLCHEAPTQPVTRPSRSSASGPIDNFPGGNPPPQVFRAFGAHCQSWDACLQGHAPPA